MRHTYVTAAAAVALFAAPFTVFAETVVVQPDSSAPASGAATGAAAGAVGGAIVGGPVGAAVGAVVGGAAGGTAGLIAEDRRPEFRTYVLKQRHPSITYEGEVVRGVKLEPTRVKYYPVPAEYNVDPTYRYTVINDTPVLVDPNHTVVDVYAGS